MKIYFASDAHLGARFHKDPLAIEKKLVRWLDSIKEDASAIWFLGDLFDYWYEYKYVVPKGHVRFLGKLAELADRGIEIHILLAERDRRHHPSGYLDSRFIRETFLPRAWR